jgi:hypothetical protein
MSRSVIYNHARGAGAHSGPVHVPAGVVQGTSMLKPVRAACIDLCLGVVDLCLGVAKGLKFQPR